MTEQTRSRVEQVTILLQAGKTSKKIIEKFSEEWSVSERTIERVINVAQSEIAKERMEEARARALVRQKHYQELEEIQIKNEKTSDAVLMDIISGNRKMKKFFCTAKGLEERVVEMDPNTIIRAINTYYKRIGARVKEQEKEKENIEKPDPFLDWELQELEAEENDVKKSVAHNESMNEVQNRVVEETPHFAATASAQHIVAEHLGNTAEKEKQKEKEEGEEKEEGKEKQKEKEKKKDNVIEPTKETKRNTHEPRTSTFNKWAIPFMPQQHYRRQMRVRVKNYPVR